MTKKTEGDSLKQWDEEADVVVVGFGGAGAVAAIAAKDAGADVLILEKQSSAKHTPSTMMSGGGSHLANDATEAAKYFKAMAMGIGLPDGYGDAPHVYPNYPEPLVEEIAQAWGEGVVGISEFLESLGSVNMEVTVPKPAFPDFPGSQSYGILSVEGSGSAFFDLLAQGVHKRGIRVLWETAGQRLAVDSPGEVNGVVAQQETKQVSIRARKAVVLTTGGFECDEELKSAFLPGWGWTFMGNPGNTGDGLRMVMGVGAALGHMHQTAARVVAGGVIADEIGTGFMCRMGHPGKILVDNYGRRYANEAFTSKDPDRYHFYKQVLTFDHFSLDYTRIPSWFIFDEKARKEGPVVQTFYGAHAVGIYEWSQSNLDEIEKGWILKGDSIEDLAAKIAAHPDNNKRMSPSVLVDTISRFNRYSEQGEDPDFQRAPERLGALQTPPYYAIAQYPGGPNTEGGPIKNAKSQVIDIFGEVIPRSPRSGVSSIRLAETSLSALSPVVLPE